MKAKPFASPNLNKVNRHLVPSFEAYAACRIENLQEVKTWMSQSMTDRVYAVYEMHPNQECILVDLVCPNVPARWFAHQGSVIAVTLRNQPLGKPANEMRAILVRTDWPKPASRCCAPKPPRPLHLPLSATNPSEVCSKRYPSAA